MPFGGRFRTKVEAPGKESVEFVGGGEPEGRIFVREECGEKVCAKGFHDFIVALSQVFLFGIVVQPLIGGSALKTWGEGLELNDGGEKKQKSK